LYFYSILVEKKKLDEIILIYPVVDHSYLDSDRDFGRIEKNRLKVEKVCLPSDWVKVIKQTDLKNSFIINFINRPLTDDLKSDGTNVVVVKDFKNNFESFLANNIENLSKVRKIKFTKSGIYGTTNLLSESFDKL
jgi:hypothetical protein